MVSPSLSHGLQRKNTLVQQCWKQLRPFIPFFLISGMIAALYFILNAIIHSGPFTDENFFEKFDRRWPKPLTSNKSSSM